MSTRPGAIALWSGAIARLQPCPTGGDGALGRKRNFLAVGAIAAEDECSRLLEYRALNDIAIRCTNVWIALGVNRSIQKAGLSVGRDSSVGAINDEMLTQAPLLLAAASAPAAPELGQAAHDKSVLGENFPKAIYYRHVIDSTKEKQLNFIHNNAESRPL